MARNDIKENNTTMTFVIPKDLKEEIFEIAVEENRSASNLVVSVLNNYVKISQAKRLLAYQQLLSELLDSDTK